MLYPLGAVLTAVFRGDLKEAGGAWMEYSVESIFGYGEQNRREGWPVSERQTLGSLKYNTVKDTVHLMTVTLLDPQGTPLS